MLHRLTQRQKIIIQQSLIQDFSEGAHQATCCVERSCYTAPHNRYQLLVIPALRTLQANRQFVKARGHNASDVPIVSILANQGKQHLTLTKVAQTSVVRSSNLYLLCIAYLHSSQLYTSTMPKYVCLSLYLLLQHVRQFQHQHVVFPETRQ